MATHGGATDGRAPSRRWVGSKLTLAHGLMVVAGLTTFVLVSVALGDRDARVDVYVAAGELAPGLTVTESDFVSVEVAATDPLLPVLVTDLPVGSILSSQLGAGDPLLRSDVVRVDAVAVGRTFTVPVDTRSIEGLGLAVGDRVDIIGLDVSGGAVYVVVDVAVTRLPVSRDSSAFAAAASRESWVTVAVDEVEALALAESRLHGDMELVRSTGAQPIELPAPSTEASANASLRSAESDRVVIESAES